MTLDEFAELVTGVDPDATRYEGDDSGGKSFTVWAEYQRMPDMADNRHIGGYRVQVDRFTKAEDDEIAASLFEALDENDSVSDSHLISYERETGYIHHIFDCEVD